MSSTIQRILTALIVILLLVVGPSMARVFEQDKNCAIHQNESIHLVMDRVCDLCHEFSSSSKPNMRWECRAQCFSTETFRSCLALFTPKRHNRHRKI